MPRGSTAKQAKKMAKLHPELNIDDHNRLKGDVLYATSPGQRDSANKAVNAGKNFGQFAQKNTEHRARNTNTTQYSY
jgi:hypothetical protein